MFKYYRRNGKYYPSVTYVLGYYPKGKFFENWLKQVGFSADYIVKKAAEEGTQVHELSEAYLNGEELRFLDDLFSFLFISLYFSLYVTYFNGE